jgi:hypothetical protein
MTWSISEGFNRMDDDSEQAAVPLPEPMPERPKGWRRFLPHTRKTWIIASVIVLVVLGGVLGGVFASGGGGGGGGDYAACKSAVKAEAVQALAEPSDNETEPAACKRLSQSQLEQIELEVFAELTGG